MWVGTTSSCCVNNQNFVIKCLVSDPTKENCRKNVNDDNAWIFVFFVGYYYYYSEVEEPYSCVTNPPEGHWLEIQAPKEYCGVHLKIVTEGNTK